MKPNLTLLAAGAVTVGLFAAGCGGGSDNSTSTSSSTSSLTKTEWIAKADAICKQGNQEINAAAHQTFQKGQKPNQAEQEKFATDSVVPSIQNQVDSIKALGAPAGQETQVNTILDSAQKSLDQAKSNPALLTDQGGKGQDPFAETNQLAKQYGLKVCGS